LTEKGDAISEEDRLRLQKYNVKTKESAKRSGAEASTSTPKKPKKPKKTKNKSAEFLPSPSPWPMREEPSPALGILPSRTSSPTQQPTTIEEIEVIKEPVAENSDNDYVVLV